MHPNQGWTQGIVQGPSDFAMAVKGQLGIAAKTCQFVDHGGVHINKKPRIRYSIDADTEKDVQTIITSRISLNRARLEQLRHVRPPIEQTEPFSQCA